MNVPRETSEQIDAYVALLREEATIQNLISKSTLDDIYNRHIADSLQLAALGQNGSWLDVGSGAGLPGIPLAILTGAPVTLVEPRPLRTAFLSRVVEKLALANVAVITGKAEKIEGSFDNITARAVASLDRLFTWTRHLGHSGTRWILPKGESAMQELESARQTWQGDFRLVKSATHPGASIVIAEKVRSRGKK